VRFSADEGLAQFFDLEWIVIRGLILPPSGEDLFGDGRNFP
jgi:hypothetical protein